MIIKNCSPSCKEIGIIIILMPAVEILLGLTGAFPPQIYFPATIGLNLAKTVVVLILGRKWGYALRSGGGPVLLKKLLLIAGGIFLLFLLNYLSGFLPGKGDGPDFPQTGGTGEALLLLIVVISAVVAEELMFRNFLLQALERGGRDRIRAMLIAALFFSMGHWYLGLPGLLFSFCGGLVLAWMYYEAGGLATTISVHLGYNLLILTIGHYFF